MIAFAELERAAREMGLDLVYAIGGTTAPDAWRWLAAGRGVAVVANRPGVASRVVAKYRVNRSGPLAPPPGYTGRGPSLMPDGTSAVTRWVLMNRLGIGTDGGLEPCDACGSIPD